MLRKEIKHHLMLLLIAILGLFVLLMGWRVGMKYTNVPLANLSQMAAVIGAIWLALLSAILGMRLHREESYPLVMSFPLSVTHVFLSKLICGIVLIICFTLSGSIFLYLISPETRHYYYAWFLLGFVINFFLLSFGFWHGCYKGARSGWPAALEIVMFIVTGFLIYITGLFFPLLLVLAYGSIGTIIIVLTIGSIELLVGALFLMRQAEWKRPWQMAFIGPFAMVIAFGVASIVCYCAYTIDHPSDFRAAIVSPLDKGHFLIQPQVERPLIYRFWDKAILRSDMKYAVPGRELLFSSKTGEFNALGAWYEMFPTAFVHPDKPLVGYAAYRPNDKMSVWSSMDWRDGRRHQWPGLTYFCNARTLSFYIGSWRPGKEEFWIPGQNRIYAFDPERAKPDEVPYPSGYSSKADAKQSGSDRFRFIDSNHLVLVQETKQRVALSVYNTDSNRWEFWEKALMKSNPPQSRLFSYWRYSNWQREKNSKRIIHSVSGWAILRIWSKEGIPGWDWVEVTDGILLGFDKGYIHAREDEWTVHEWGTHSQIGAVPYKEYLDPEIQPNDALEFCGDGPIFMKRSGAAKDAILFDLTSMAAVPLLKGIQKLETRSDPLWVYQIDRPQGREYRLYDRRDGSDSTIFTLPPMPK